MTHAEKIEKARAKIAQMREKLSEVQRIAMEQEEAMQAEIQVLENVVHAADGGFSRDIIEQSARISNMPCTCKEGIFGRGMDICTPCFAKDVLEHAKRENEKLEKILDAL